ncbi:MULTISPECIES: acetylserotonin O-methyltransferase [unclassified Cyanobium]|uniref:acetylserotonin O-methyltransferase n=1 Tax=unclassified Cyanobium TaxID=2627006 RepID=UPI0020CF7009|nr:MULTISPECIES: acetylserotonin O-methyltransferase [unclassified Cyanobium]MCP9835728.1 methyltransferase [Cyanobium sp. La Preciosa 7G6]MCP9938514.1 methyltransferase [Cyanobium sp. Aljojuca 7A6]
MDPNADLTSRFLQLACGNWITQMLHVAAELAIADHLAVASPQGLTAEELAGRCGADGESLFRLLRGLASLGLFAETDPRRFVLTPLAELLRSDHPGSQRQFMRMLGGEHYDAWADLLHSVRSGESAFRHRFGEPVFDWYGHNPERGAIFNGAMTDFSRVETEGLLATWDFSRATHLVDVGGGRGQLLQAVLHQHGHLRGTLFDQPAVVAPVAVPPALAGRFAVAAGDFFTAVPAGGDTYLLKHILHDWGDDACLTILGHIRAGLAPGGRVLILEQVIPPGNAPAPGKLLDLNMLVMTEGGRERTPDAYGHLLQRAGLRLAALHPTPSPVTVIEAVAA